MLEHRLFYFFYFIPENHKFNKTVMSKKLSFVVWRKSHLSFALPSLQNTFTPPQLLIPQEDLREREKLHLWLQNKCITVWVCCPDSSASPAWNAPRRQSGATGAWRLAAGRDNLPRDREQRAAKALRPGSTPPWSPETRRFRKGPGDIS